MKTRYRPRKLVRCGLAPALLLAASALATANAQVNGDACTLLSVDEVSQIVGQRVRPPRPDTAQEGTSCSFPTATDTVTIALWPTDAQSFEEARDFLSEIGEELEPATNIGDAAYFWGDRIYVRKGARGLTIYIGGAGDGSDLERREMVVALANAALAKVH